MFVAAFVVASWARLPIGFMHNEQRYVHLLVPALAAGLALSLLEDAIERGGARGDDVPLVRRPPHLVVSREWERVFGLSEGLRRAGWRLTLLRDSARGFRVYALAR